jgi:hypothetical protein
MAFRPSPHEAWLGLFSKTIHKLWELQPCDVPTERNTSFKVPLLSLICEYSVETAEKYVGSIRLTANQPRLLFTVQSDPAFASKAGLHNAHGNYPREDCTRRLKGDVQSVLDGMIFHPRNHAHLEEYGLMATEPLLLTLHEVRVSGGIENAFVFLFHLRYQFCLVSEETRDSERDRLVNLFTTAIKDRRTHVPPSELFDFRR